MTIEALGRAIIDRIAEEWRKQGHRLTGAFEQAMSYEVEGDYLRIYDNTGRGYGKILEHGVPPERIPFSPGSGAKNSQYIQGLVNYAKLRMGVDDKLALSIAFAIAHVHIREGMPTKASARFSSTGRRVGFVEDSVPEIERLVEQYIETLIAL